MQRQFSVALGLILLFTFSCSSPQPVETTVSWHEGMKRFSDSMIYMIPILSKRENLKSPDKQKRLRKYTDQLASVSHQIQGSSMGKTWDPSFHAVSQDLSAELSDSIKAMNEDRWDYARSKLRTVSSYCISCHTMNQTGARQFQFGIEDPEIRTLESYDRAELMAAVRNFDQAIIEYEYFLTDKKQAAKRPHDWNAAFQKMLAIIVRVKRDPSLALEQVSRFFDAYAYPSELRTSAQVWRQQIKEWRKEESTSKKTGTNLEQAQRLLKNIDPFSRNQTEVNFIRILRASSYLADELQTKPGRKSLAQALLLYGDTALALGEINLWTLHRPLYEACKKEDPKGKTGRQCVDRLKKVEEFEKQL